MWDHGGEGNLRPVQPQGQPWSLGPCEHLIVVPCPCLGGLCPQKCLFQGSSSLCWRLKAPGPAQPLSRLQLVRLCNEGARKMERTEMMYTINSQLEFKIKVG